MYFALGVKEKKEKIFSKEEAIQKALEIINNNYKDWTFFTNFHLCDILLIRNFVGNVEENLVTNPSQPFFKVNLRLFQKIIAINFLDKNETLSEDVVSKLADITCAHIITSNPQSIRKIIDELS